MFRWINILTLRLMYMLIYATGAAVGLYFVVLFPLFGALLFVAWICQRMRKLQPLSTAHGTARWGNYLDLYRAGLINQGGLILGKLADAERPSMPYVLTALFLWHPRRSAEAVNLIRRRLGFGTEPIVRLHDFGIPHLAAFGASGSGKSTSFVIPNLLSDPTPAIVLDVKGELFRATSHYRSLYFGHKIAKIDCFNIAPSDKFPAQGFDPLSLTDASSVQAVDDARRLSNALVVRNPNTNEPFWDNAAQIIIQAIMVFMFAKARPGEANLNNLRDILCSPRALKQAMKAMQDATEFQGLLARMGNQIRYFQGKTRASTMSVLGTHLDFLDSLPVAATVAKSTFDPREILTSPMTIYLCLPVDRLRELSGLQRVILTSLINMIFQAGESRTRRIRFYLDEMATISEIESVYNALVYGRAFGIRLFMAFQAASQVELCFPKSKANDFRATVASLYCGTGDFQTAEQISQWIGQSGAHTYSSQTSHNTGFSATYGAQGSSSVNQGDSYSVTVSETARAVIRPEEILQLPKNQAIVLLPNVRPFRVIKMPYYLMPSRARPVLARIIEYVMLTACTMAISIAAYFVL